MTNSLRGSLYPALFGIVVVVALASVLVVSTWSQSAIPLSYGTGGSGGGGGSGWLLVCPPYCTADVDEEEAAIAENASMAGSGANETGTGNMTSGTNSTS